MNRSPSTRPPLERMLRIHQAHPVGRAIPTPPRSRANWKSAPNPFTATSSSCATGWSCRSSTTAAGSAIFYTEEVSAFPTLQDHRGRTLRAGRRREGPPAISRHQLREAAAQRPQEDGAVPARHHFAQPDRRRADHLLPHPRRADPGPGSLRRPGQGHRRAPAARD